MPFEDHPHRLAMANELHARPFPVVAAPAHGAYLALSADGPRDQAAERAHLIELLDRHGAPHPPPGAAHHSAKLGRYQLKWESHTEFVTYTMLAPGLPDRSFDATGFEVFPADWRDRAPGVRVTSALLRVEAGLSEEAIVDRLADWFEPESLAVSRVLEDDLVIAGDFRIDPSGHMRLALFPKAETGERRIGRVVQRLCEIETYKAMSMLGLFMARDLGAPLDRVERRLTGLVSGLGADGAAPEETLQALLAISAELEDIASHSSFRFGATGAYETIVAQRVSILREERFLGRQTFGEFMMRRFDPAMRTVRATEARLRAMSERARRAGDLLRTRVDVERSAQNQALLASMDRRADLQLHLQKTVEGLSVVAVSYYAVNLVLYLLGPLAEPLGLSKTVLGALAVPPVVALVWFGLHRVRRSLG